MPADATEAGVARPEHPPFLGAWSGEEETVDRPNREPLSRNRIVGTAVDLLDRHGIEALSMRSLAQAMHTAPTSLYRHVHNKGELQDLAVDALMAEVELPPDDIAWQAGMRAVALNFRAVLLKHHSAAMLRGTRLAIGPNTLRLMEWVCAKLLASGFLEQDAADVAATVINYTVGSVLGEVLPTAQIEQAGYTWQEFAAQMQTRVDALPLERYPVMRRMFPMLLGHHHDRPFEYGLDALLDGLAARLAVAPGAVAPTAVTPAAGEAPLP
jgi:AcrR family transcriptional regulator